MGDVVYLRQASPPPMATPMPSAWAFQHLDLFFDLGNWRVSAKGNRYCRIGRYCVTTFPRPGGFAWCIAAGGKDRPLWSPETLGSERLARIAAWDALVEVVRAEER